MQRLAKSLLEIGEEGRLSDGWRQLSKTIQSMLEPAVFWVRSTEAGLNEAALEQFKASVDIYPYTPDVQEALVRLLLALGEVDRAARHNAIWTSSTTARAAEGMEMTGHPHEAASDVALFESLGETREKLLGEIRKVIVGQEEVVEQMLTALFAQGHCLFIGVPGLAKTLLVSTTAEALGLGFNRIQFTPDLMPSDITGTEVLEEDKATGEGTLRFIEGQCSRTSCSPMRSIERHPNSGSLASGHAGARDQCGGKEPGSERPFRVFATQNPIEQEGTYPLPEAQLIASCSPLRWDIPPRPRKSKSSGAP